jgi:hypothetical protein
VTALAAIVLGLGCGVIGFWALLAWACDVPPDDGSPREFVSDRHAKRVAAAEAQAGGSAA